MGSCFERGPGMRETQDRTPLTVSGWVRRRRSYTRHPSPSAMSRLARVDLASGYLLAWRTAHAGTYITEHTDPANTTHDGVFIAEFALPHIL